MDGQRSNLPTTLAAVAVALGLAFAPVACSDDEGGSTEAFCDQVVAVPSLDLTVAGLADVDPAELDARVQEARGAYDDLEASAPSAVRDDVTEVVDLVDDVLDAAEAHPDDPAAVADQVRAGMDEHAGAEAARTRMVAFAAEECGVTLDPTAATASTTTADPVATTSAGG